MKKLSLQLFIVVFCTTLIGYSQEVPENLSETEKLYGLSIVWKEADKNFVYFDQVPDLDWDKAYQEFIPKVLNTKNTYEYYRELQAFCALLNDGHTRVVVPWQLRKIHEVKPPVVTELVGDRVIIKEIQNDTLKQRGLKVGVEVVEIDGIKVHEYASKKVKPYTSYSTEHDMNVWVYEYHLLKGHIDKKIMLKTKKGKEFLISRRLSNNSPEKQVFEYKVLKNGTGYLKINQFYGENVKGKFDSIYKQLKSTPKLIIDVSENFGGSSEYSHYVLKHFVDKPFKTSRWKTLMYMPAYASWGWGKQWIDNEGSTIYPLEASKRYTKPLVVLISEKTYSAGEDFVSAFLNTKRGVVIGRPTAGTTGNPIGFDIPGEGGLQICSKRDYLATGEEFVGYGIKPNITITKTDDKDHLIKAGLEKLKKNN